MKYFSINYWVKMWLLSVAFVNQQNKNIYGLPFVTKLTNNLLIPIILSNETIVTNQLLNDNQNDTSLVFAFNSNRSKKEAQLIMTNLLKSNEMSKEQVAALIIEQQMQPFIREKGEIIVDRKVKRQVSSISQSMSEINKIRPERIRLFEPSRIKSFIKDELQSFTEQQIPYFTPEQVTAFTIKQIPWFTINQIQAFSQEQISWLTKEQIQALTLNQIRALQEEQIKNSQQLLLRKKQIMIFNVTTINSYDLENQTVTTKLNQQRLPKL